MTSPDIALIAKGLSKAQREQVLLWDAADFELGGPERQSLALSVREGIRPLVALGIATKPNTRMRQSARLTQLGLAVKSYLERNPND